jgi:hypothetical protein
MSVRSVTSRRFFIGAQRLGYLSDDTDDLTTLRSSSLCWDSSLSLRTRDDGTASGLFGKNGRVGSYPGVAEGWI